MCQKLPFFWLRSFVPCPSMSSCPAWVPAGHEAEACRYLKERACEVAPAAFCTGGGMHPARQLAGRQQPSPVPGPFLFLGSMWGSLALVFSASPIIFFEVYLEKSCLGLTRGRQPKPRPRQPSISSRTAPASSSVRPHLPFWVPFRPSTLRSPASEYFRSNPI